MYTRGVEDPGEFATAYAAFAGSLSPEDSRAQVRVGYFSQVEPVWVRIQDRSSTWGVDNGLKSVLTTALTFGIAGYQFVLTDIIGGNGEDPARFDEPYTPSPELYIRWMQLNAFLPVMQFSVPPFHYGVVDGGQCNRARTRTSQDSSRIVWENVQPLEASRGEWIPDHPSRVVDGR